MSRARQHVSRKTLLFVVSLTGPAQAMTPVIQALSSRYDCVLVGVSKGNSLFPDVGGSLETWQGLFEGLYDMAYVGSTPSDLSSFLKTLSPAAVILGSVCDPHTGRDYPEKHMMTAAKEQGITTIQYVDTWGAWDRQGAVADQICVCDALTQTLGQKLFPHQSGDCFHIVGHPELQRFYEQSPKRVLHSVTPIHACYFTQINVNTREALEWLASALSAEDHLWIKRHPMDRQNYEAVLESHKVQVSITQKSPEEIYARINLCITHTSVVGVKAVLLGIPTFNIKPREHMREMYDLLGGYPLSIAGYSQEVNSEQELTQALVNISHTTRRPDPSGLIVPDATDAFVRALDVVINEKEKSYV